MAAPNPPDDNALPNDNWGPQDDHSMGPTSNGQGASGQPLSIDDRAVVQDPENPDYPRGSSVGDNDIYREKQIKVLRFFLSVLCLLDGSSALVHPVGVSVLSRLCVLDTFCFRSGGLSLLDCSFDFASNSGVYFLLCSRTKYILAGFQNILVRKIFKTASAKLDAS